MQGKSINGFTLQRLIGIGGMAEVWYAENVIGKKAAVKLLLSRLCDDEVVKTRFFNEAKVMVELTHPNIRQVYDYGNIDGRPAIVMEYLEGKDLKAMLKEEHHFTDEELRKWWDQLVSALNYTHNRRIVHRDIKPSNIFIDDENNVKLLDFGIAKAQKSHSATQTGQKIGTLMYMSPEQVKDSKHIDYHTDLYSLAVTFVHLLTGKRPYNRDKSSDFDIMTNIVTKPLDMNGVPTAWRNFLLPYLEKDPAKRPPLRKFEQRLSVGTKPVPTVVEPLPITEVYSTKSKPKSNFVPPTPIIVTPTPTTNDVVSTPSPNNVLQTPNPSDVDVTPDTGNAFWRKMKAPAIIALVLFSLFSVLWLLMTLSNDTYYFDFHSTNISIFQWYLLLPTIFCFASVFVRIIKKDYKIWKYLSTISILTAFVIALYFFFYDDIWWISDLTVYFAVYAGLLAEISLFNFVNEKQRSLPWWVFLALVVMIVIWIISISERWSILVDWLIPLASAIPVISLLAILEKPRNTVPATIAVYLLSALAVGSFLGTYFVSLKAEIDFNVQWYLLVPMFFYFASLYVRIIKKDERIWKYLLTIAIMIVFVMAIAFYFSYYYNNDDRALAIGVPFALFTSIVAEASLFVLVNEKQRSLPWWVLWAMVVVFVSYYAFLHTEDWMLLIASAIPMVSLLTILEKPIAHNS